MKQDNCNVVTKIILWIIIVTASFALLITCHYNEELLKNKTKFFRQNRENIINEVNK
jgi:hypothetical protein